MHRTAAHHIHIIAALATLLLLLPQVSTAQQQTILKYIGEVVGGEVFAPHLYDLHFDGVNQYAVVGLQPDNWGTPFTVYGWSEITIEELIYPVWPKANAFFSKTSMIGDQWVDRVATYYQIENRQDYTWMIVEMQTKSADGSTGWYSTSVYAYRNSWVHVVRRFTASRELSYWLNGNRVARWSIPSTERTILEWNPDTATYPERYKRFVLGANVIFGEHMTVRYGYVRIYSRALTDEEISNAMRGVVNASGLRLFIDPTFFDGYKYIDLSGNGNHAYPYNKPSRVPSNNTFLWVVRGLYSDNLVRFRFVPEGWHIVVRLLSGEEIIHIDTSFIDAPRVYGFVDNITINIFTPGRYEVILSSVYPPVEEAVPMAVGFGENIAVFILSALCLGMAGIVGGFRKPELTILVSSLYTATVLVYASNPYGGLWGAAVSIAGLSLPVVLLIIVARGMQRDPAAIASLVVSLAIYLPTLGLSASIGATPMAGAGIYAVIAVVATVIAVARSIVSRRTFVV